MARPLSEDLKRQRRLLSKTLRLIREERRMTAVEVAKAMDMDVRAYRSFEQGKGDLDLFVIRRFAVATDCDAAGVIASLILGSPEPALRTIHNKAFSVMFAAYRLFNEAAGDRAATLEAAAFIRVFEEAFAELGKHLSRRDTKAEKWLEDNLEKLYGAAPKR